MSSETMVSNGRLGLVSRGPRGQLRGGSRLPAQVVAGDQRERLLGAVVAVVAAHGLADARILDIRRLAGVSQATLYDHYAGVGDLLLSACDRWLAGLLDDVERAVAGRRSWPDGVRDGLGCLLEGVTAQPELARCSFVELCGLGTPGEECRRRALERLAVLLRPQGWNPGGELSISDQVLAGGVWHAVQAAILTGGTRHVVSLLPRLHAHVLACGIGDDQDRAG